MNLEFGNTKYLFLLLILPIILLLNFSFLKRKKRTKNTFAEKRFHDLIFSREENFSKFVPFLLILAVSFLVLAMTDLISTEKEKIQVTQKSGNVIFLVDISNSMNAGDIETSRLEHAKQIVIQSLRNLTDEKVGIVVFAGEAHSIMPLTTDYSTADLYIRNIETLLIQKQGTDFFLAVQEADKKLNKAFSGAKKIILISDGEDNEDNYQKAINLAKENNISISTVGIGTEEGAPIPEYQFNFYSDFKKNEYGETIITKRQTNVLKSLAEQTNGKYIDGNNLAESVREIIKDIKSSGKEQTKSHIYTQNTSHYFQWLLGISVFLFFIIYIFNPKKDLNI